MHIPDQLTLRYDVIYQDTTDTFVLQPPAFRLCDTFCSDRERLPSNHPQSPHLTLQLCLAKRPCPLPALTPHSTMPSSRPHPLARPFMAPTPIPSKPIPTAHTHHARHLHSPIRPATCPSPPSPLNPSNPAPTEPPQVPEDPKPEEDAQCKDVVEHKREGRSCEPVRPLR